MKKAILILLCLIILCGVVSCDTSDYIDEKNIIIKQKLEKNNDSTDTSENNEQLTHTPDSETLKVDGISLEKYIGTWYDDFIPPNDLEIISKENGEIECSLGIYRLTTFCLIMTQGDEEISFVDKNNLISGKIDFKDDSVLVTIEESNTEYIQNGASYLFTIKDETNVE